MPAETLQVKGYREFLRACDRAGKETRREVRGTFRKVGDIVKADWSRQLARVDRRSAAGLRTVVRVRGVAVEQSLPRTTGLHPEYGVLQMRMGIEALREEQDTVEREMEAAIGKVADHFEQI